MWFLDIFWSWLLQWLGIWLDFIIAAALIVGGGYLEFYLGANPLTPFSGLFCLSGRALIAAGIIVAALAYGKSVGAADCEARWKAANYELQIANLKRDLSAARQLADFQKQEAAELAAQKLDADAKIEDYDKSIATLSGTLAACRRASGDDDRRVCDIIGNAAAGCRAAR